MRVGALTRTLPWACPIRNPRPSRASPAYAIRPIAEMLAPGSQCAAFVSISPDTVQSPAPLSDVLTARKRTVDACVANFPARVAMLDAGASALPWHATMPVVQRQIHHRTRDHLRHARVRLRDAVQLSPTRPRPTSTGARPTSRHARPTSPRMGQTPRGLQFSPKPAVSTSKHPNR